MALQIERILESRFEFSLDGGDPISDNAPNLTTFGNICHFKTRNGANIIANQNVTYADVTVVDTFGGSGSFTFANIQELWVKLIELQFFDGLASGGGTGATRFDALTDAFTYFGNDGKVPVVDESQLELVATTFYNFNQFIQLEDVSISTLVDGKILGVALVGGTPKIVLTDPTEPSAEYFSAVGGFYYADLTTQTTPLAYTTGNLQLENDIEGGDTFLTQPPYGITSVWDESTNTFDFSELSIGDEVFIRVDLLVTTSAADQTSNVKILLGEGTADEKTIVLNTFYTEVAAETAMTSKINFTLQNENWRTTAAKLLFTSDASADIEVVGFHPYIVRKSINVLDVTDTTFKTFTVAQLASPTVDVTTTVGTVKIGYEGVGNKLTNILFDSIFSQYLVGFNELLGTKNLEISIYNKTKKKLISASINDFTEVSAGYYNVELEESIDLINVSLNDELDFNINSSPLSTAVGSNPVENEYSDIASMLSDQSNQTEGWFNYVVDASADPNIASGDAYYEKKATSTATLADDYRLLTDTEITVVANSNNYRTLKIQDVSATSVTSVSGGKVSFEYTGANATAIIFNKLMTDALIDFYATDVDIVFYNKGSKKYETESIASGAWTTVNTDYYRGAFTGTKIQTADLTQADALDFFIMPSTTGGGGVTPDLQTAYTTTLLFDQNRVSTFGDSTDNSHTQSGAIVLGYDFTGAIEGVVRVLEIISDGNTITIPSGVNKTGFLKYNGTTLLSIANFVITPESGQQYMFHFWYTNGYVNVLIIDSERLSTDGTPPTFSVAPASDNIAATSFDITATLNENGTVYAVVVADGATAPTSTEVKAGTGSGGSGQLATDNDLDSGAGVTLNLIGLTAETAYDVYVVAEDSVGNLMASPTKLDVTTIAESATLPDVSGYDITRIYALQETQQSTLDYPISITDGSANDYEVFFDTNGKISLSSKIGTGATPSANDLQWYIDNELVGSTIYVTDIRCHITGHVFSTTGTHAVLWTLGGGLVTKDGETSIQFQGTGALIGTALTELNDGNIYSISLGASNESGTVQCAVFTNGANTSGNYLVINNDRRTQKRIFTLKDASSTLFFADALAQDDSTNLKRLSVTVDTAGNIESYKSGVSQTTTSISSQTGYTNSSSNLGAFGDGTNALTGKWKYLLIHNAIQSDAEETALDLILANF